MAKARGLLIMCCRDGSDRQCAHSDALSISRKKTATRGWEWRRGDRGVKHASQCRCLERTGVKQAFEVGPVGFVTAPEPWNRPDQTRRMLPPAHLGSFLSHLVGGTGTSQLGLSTKKQELSFLFAACHWRHHGSGRPSPKRESQPHGLKVRDWSRGIWGLRHNFGLGESLRCGRVVLR